MRKWLGRSGGCMAKGSFRMSASMDNLMHYVGSGSRTGGNTPGSPAADKHEGGADEYAWENFVQGSSFGYRERKKGVPWTEKSIGCFYGDCRNWERRIGKG